MYVDGKPVRGFVGGADKQVKVVRAWEATLLDSPCGRVQVVPTGTKGFANRLGLGFGRISDADDDYGPDNDQTQDVETVEVDDECGDVMKREAEAGVLG